MPSGTDITTQRISILPIGDGRCCSENPVTAIIVRNPVHSRAARYTPDFAIWSYSHFWRPLSQPARPGQANPVPSLELVQNEGLRNIVSERLRITCKNLRQTSGGSVWRSATGGERTFAVRRALRAPRMSRVGTSAEGRLPESPEQPAVAAKFIRRYRLPKAHEWAGHMGNVGQNQGETTCRKRSISWSWVAAPPAR